MMDEISGNSVLDTLLTIKYDTLDVIFEMSPVAMILM